MEWLLGLILQLFSTGDDISHAVMEKPFKAVIQEHVVCRTYFDHHEEEFQEAMRIENPGYDRTRWNL